MAYIWPNAVIIIIIITPAPLTASVVKGDGGSVEGKQCNNVVKEEFKGEQDFC